MRRCKKTAMMEALTLWMWWGERTCAQHALEFQPPVPLSLAECIPSDVSCHFTCRLSKTKLKTIPSDQLSPLGFPPCHGCHNYLLLRLRTGDVFASTLCHPLIASITRLSGLCSVSPDHPTRVPPPWIQPPPTCLSLSPLHSRLHTMLMEPPKTQSSFPAHWWWWVPCHSTFPIWVIWSLFLCKLISKLKFLISLVFPEY